MVSFHPPVAAQMLAVGESASAATTLHKRRLRLTSLRLALANSSVKSSGMGARGHAHPVKTPVSNAYRFISGNFQLRPEPSKHVPKFVYKDQASTLGWWGNQGDLPPSANQKHPVAGADRFIEQDRDPFAAFGDINRLMFDLDGTDRHSHHAGCGPLDHQLVTCRKSHICHLDFRAARLAVIIHHLADLAFAPGRAVAVGVRPLVQRFPQEESGREAAV